MLLLNCDNCDKKKSTFIKDKELQNFKNISNDYFKMNKIMSKFLIELRQNYARTPFETARIYL